MTAALEQVEAHVQLTVARKCTADALKRRLGALLADDLLDSLGTPIQAYKITWDPAPPPRTPNVSDEELGRLNAATNATLGHEAYAAFQNTPAGKQAAYLVRKWRSLAWHTPRPDEPPLYVWRSPVERPIHFPDITEPVVVGPAAALELRWLRSAPLKSTVLLDPEPEGPCVSFGPWRVLADKMGHAQKFKPFWRVVRDWPGGDERDTGWLESETEAVAVCDALNGLEAAGKHRVPLTAERLTALLKELDRSALDTRTAESDAAWLLPRLTGEVA